MGVSQQCCDKSSHTYVVIYVEVPLQNKPTKMSCWVTGILFVFYCYLTNDHKLSSLNQHLFISSQSVGQKPGLVWLVSLLRVKSWCWPGFVPTWRLWGKILSQAPSSHGQSLVPSGCRTKVSGFLLTVSWGPPSAPRWHWHSLPCSFPQWHGEFFSCFRSLTSPPEPSQRKCSTLKGSPGQILPTQDHLSTLKSTNLGSSLHL